MNKLLFVGFLVLFLGGCAGQEEVAAYHPTDALLIGGNGPFNAAPDADDVVDLDQNDSY